MREELVGMVDWLSDSGGFLFVGSDNLFGRPPQNVVESLMTSLTIV